MSKQTALKLMVTLKYKEIFRDSVTKILEPTLTADNSAHLVPVYAELLSQILTKTDLLEGIAQSYDDIFTESELQELIVFFSTPIGLKLTENQLNLAMASAEVLSEKIGELRTGLLSI